MKKKIFLFILSMISLAGLSQKRFEAKKLGFSMEIPKDWITVENSDILKNLNNYEFSDKQVNELLKSNSSSLNLVTYTKYDSKNVSGIIPTIKIRTANNPTNNSKDFSDFVALGVDNLKKSFEDFKFVVTPVILKISDCDVAQFSVQFTLQSGGKAYEIKSDSYYIPKDDYYISLNFIEEVGAESNSLLFQKLVASLELTKL